MNNELLINRVFSVPIWKTSIQCDVNYLQNICYTIRETTNNILMTNIGGYQSSNIDWELFGSLKLDIQNILDKISNNINEKCKFEIASSWFNINNGMNYNLHHEHPYSALSGVFYIKCNKNSGNIRFDSNSLMKHYPFNSYDSELFNTYFDYQPEQMDLIIFPSWLTHSVFPSKDNEDRISLAFNTKQI